MRLHCLACGKVVSTEVPDSTVVRAALECPECIEKTWVPGQLMGWLSTKLVAPKTEALDDNRGIEFVPDDPDADFSASGPCTLILHPVTSEEQTDDRK